MPYVGLVASRKRGDGGASPRSTVTDDERARVHTPAGLDIGARTPEEVALSILAEIVSPAAAPRRTAGRRADRAERARRDRAIDPVCGMTVATVESSLHLDHDGARLLVLRHRLPAAPSPPTRARYVRAVTDARSGRAGPRRRRRCAARSTRVDYLADAGLATALFCAVRLPQPLLLEGEAGVGKTEAAKALAARARHAAAPAAVLRGHRRAEALYEWNYPRQLLGIRLAEARGRGRSTRHDLFGRDYLVEPAAAAGDRASRAAARRCC